MGRGAARQPPGRSRRAREGREGALLLKQEIEKYGAAFKGFESIQDFALVAEDFTTDNGMLTPSLKLKRRKVIEAHGPVIEALYAKRAAKGQSSARTATA